MLVYRAEVRLPDNATYYEIEEAKINADWKFLGNKELRSEQMKRTNLKNKCGSCKYFCEMPSLTSRCYGKCEKGRAGYKPRSTKACQLYEERSTKECDT